jgi:FRG domain
MVIPEISFVTVPQYLHKVFAYPNVAWIYRGQADATWYLLPKAGRQEYFLPELNKPESEGLLPRDICRFSHWRKLAVAYHKQLPANDFECLAFAQHYGLATRLLDWSTNPLAALFFAVDSCSSCNGAVYAHSPHGHIDSQVAKLGSFPYIGQFTPPPFDPRILLQSGVFTYHPEPNVPLSPEPVHDLHGLTPDHGLNLVRFVVQADMKPILKRQLDEIGINRKSLFPDLDGLSDYVNWETRRSAP